MRVCSAVLNFPNYVARMPFTANRERTPLLYLSTIQSVSLYLLQFVSLVFV